MQDNRNHEDETLVSRTLHDAANRLVQAQRHAILLVEDTAAHAAIIRRALDTSVWEIEHVTRAEEALRAFELNSNRIVILDLSLPDSDGLELLSRLHGINATSPVIVVTATDQVQVSVEAMKKGAWDYVVKSDPKESTEHIVLAIERAWKGRLRAAESNLVESSRIMELVRAERLEAIEGIVKTVCSEVNNPLSGVMALSQLLQQRENLDSDLQRLVDGIVKSAGQVASVVNKLKSINESEPNARPQMSDEHDESPAEETSEASAPPPGS